LRRNQTERTGTSVLESRYDAIIEKPTARAMGTKRALAAPTMKKAGMKTARIHNIASRRGRAVSRVPSRAARASGAPRPRWAWMFSTATVDSSTRMPMARARPPRVIRWIDWPVIQRANTAARRESGNVDDDDEGAAPIAEEEQHHEAGEEGAEAAFLEHVFDGAVDDGRLVEDVADLDVVGQDFLKLGDVLFDEVDDFEASRRRRAW
jgi:hypothetical protein